MSTGSRSWGSDEFCQAEAFVTIHFDKHVLEGTGRYRFLIVYLSCFLMLQINSCSTYPQTTLNHQWQSIPPSTSNILKSSAGSKIDPGQQMCYEHHVTIRAWRLEAIKPQPGWGNKGISHAKVNNLRWSDKTYIEQAQYSACRTHRWASAIIPLY